MSEAVEAEALSYATPSRTGGAAGVGFALIFGGLGLIFLCGCFLIGILILNNLAAGISFNAVPRGMTPGQILLAVVLYLAAFGCFGGGA